MSAVQEFLFPGIPLPAERGATKKTLAGGLVRYKSGPNGFARYPGTGPKGETCKTCANCCRVQGGTRVFLKCKVIEFRWTHGPGTDIRAKSPACELWKEKTPNAKP